MAVVVSALTVLGWIIVAALVLVAILSVIYWKGRRPTPAEIEEHRLEEAERSSRPEPPGMSPH